MYDQRTYRHQIKDSDLFSFTVTVKETDLLVRARSDLTGLTLATVEKLRSGLERYIREHPLFLHSLKPLPAEPGAPRLVRLMIKAGQAAGVGPMAAVAGAMAELVGTALLRHTAEVMIENGGDIFIKTAKRRRIGVFAGDSPFTGKLAIEIEPEDTPLGVCTSSGTVGPSLSLGSSDATIILSKSAALADAAATAVGNMVKTAEDIQDALDRGRGIKGVIGVMIIAGDRMGVWGAVRLVRS